MIVGQVLSLVFGFLRSQEIKDNNTSSLKVSIVNSSNSGVTDHTEEDSSDSNGDEDYTHQGGYFDPPIKLAGKSQIFIIKQKAIKAKQNPIQKRNSLDNGGSFNGNDLNIGNSVGIDDKNWLNSNSPRYQDDLVSQSIFNSGHDLKSDLNDNSVISDND